MILVLACDIVARLVIWPYEVSVSLILGVIGTLVFLMGLSRLRQISDQLIEKGKDARTPAAVIASGTTARQRCVTADLSRIAETAEEASIQPPAILVVGDVVNLKEAVDWQQPGPLSGRKILVTATEIIARPLAEHIRRLGGEPVVMSLIGVKGQEMSSIKAVLTSPGKRWLVFTSRNGVRFFFEQMQKGEGGYQKSWRQQDCGHGCRNPQRTGELGLLCGSGAGTVM